MKRDEKILVVPTLAIFPTGSFQGFLPQQDFKDHEQLIATHQEFLWRSAMEEDPSYKQIIPYLVFRHADRYFLMRRRSDASEVRLQNKCSLGIGGHIREEDMRDSTLVSWAEREFNEEVAYAGNLTIKPLGMINDDSNPVGQVHVGFVFLLEGDSADICIKSELKEGNLLTLDAMQPMYEQMESWTQMVFDYLVMLDQPVPNIDNLFDQRII